MTTEKTMKTRYLAAMIAAFAPPVAGAEGPPWVVEGGEFDLPAGTWETTGESAAPLWLKGGAKVVGLDVDLKTSGANAYAARAQGAGSFLTLGTAHLQTTGLGARGLSLEGGAGAKLTNVTVTTVGGSAHGVHLTDKATEARFIGGSVTTSGYAAVGILAEDGAQFSVESAHVTTSNTAAHGLAALGVSASLRAKDSTVETHGEGANGVQVNASVTAVLVDTSITTEGRGASAVHANDGSGLVTVTGGRWSTTGREAHGFEGANQALARITGTHIETTGFNAAGILSQAGSVGIDDVDILTHGDQGFGILAKGGDYPGRNPTVDAESGHIVTEGRLAYGASARQGGRVILDRTTIHTSGEKAHGLRAWDGTISASGTTVLTTGSGAYGAEVREGGSLTVQGGSLLSEQAAALRLYDPVKVRISGGALLGGTAFAEVYPTSTAPFTLVVEGKSQAIGDILLAAPEANDAPPVDATKASLTLRSAATWHGGTDIVRDLTLEDEGTWSITRDSRVGSLNSDHGVVTFASAPGTFATLTVAGDYDGNQGLFRMRSQLGDDSSASDLLHIMGNTSGRSLIAVDALDGAGNYTKDGIRLVRVDGNSHGRFELAGRAVAGAHEYFLHQGALSATGDGHWYLRSSLEPDPPVEPIVVVPPVTPDPEVLPDPEPEIGPRVLRPEVGTYRANQTAALEMFQNGPGAGEDEERDGARQSVWARFDRRHTTFDIGNQLTTTSSSNELTLGADLFRHPDSEAHVGVMAAVGRADTRATSLLTHYAAKGRVRGQAAGIYGGVRTDDGTYVRGWTQYAHVNQRVEGDALAAERYGSGMLTASLEAGHRWRYALNRDTDTYVEPQAQITATRLRGGSHTEANGSRIAPLHASGATARLGVRTAARWNTPGGHVASPYFAANWIRRLGHLDATRFNNETFDAGVPRNSYGLKLGVAFLRNSGWRAWTDVETRFGAHRYRRVTGSIGIRKAW